MGQKVVIELPDTPNLSRYEDDGRVPIIEGFLIWLHNHHNYALIEDDYRDADPVELGYDFIREGIITDFLGYDYNAIQEERANLKEIAKWTVKGAFIE
jgi:hypothetical protein